MRTIAVIVALTIGLAAQADAVEPLPIKKPLMNRLFRQTQSQTDRQAVVDAFKSLSHQDRRLVKQVLRGKATIARTSVSMNGVQQRRLDVSGARGSFSIDLMAAAVRNLSTTQQPIVGATIRSGARRQVTVEQDLGTVGPGQKVVGVTLSF